MEFPEERGKGVGPGPEPPPGTEDDVGVILGPGIVLVIKVEEEPPPSNDIVQVFSSLIRLAPSGPVIGVITMVHV